MRQCDQICFITGPPQCGKTTFLRKISEHAKVLGLSLGGFMAIGLWQNNRRSGFMLEELASGVQTPLSGRSAASTEMGGYVFYPAGFAAGLKTLTPAALQGKDLLCVDEVGWLETRGDGWAPALPGLLEMPVSQIWVVRDAMQAEVCRRWNFQPGLILDPTDSQAEALARAWLEALKP